jgi:hypothetical protein
MTEAPARLAAVHGVLGWIAAVLLAGAAMLLALRRDAALGRLRALAGLAFALLAAAFASGVLLDQPYRTRLRQRLFLASRALGWAFERKQHLAYGALLLASAALAALLARRPASDPDDRALVRASRTGLLAAALFALAAAAISTVVASRVRFQ